MYRLVTVLKLVLIVKPVSLETSLKAIFCLHYRKLKKFYERQIDVRFNTFSLYTTANMQNYDIVNCFELQEKKSCIRELVTYR